jgi:hypothetical protein
MATQPSARVRGEIVLVGLSVGRIPRPVGRRGSAQALAVFGGLADAVRRSGRGWQSPAPTAPSSCFGATCPPHAIPCHADFPNALLT